MRYMLTGDEFGAAEALRMRLVSEVVPPDTVLDRAVALATRISRAAPLGVRAVIASANEARSEGDEVALAHLYDRLRALITSADAREGAMAGLQKREPEFAGK